MKAVTPVQPQDSSSSSSSSNTTTTTSSSQLHLHYLSKQSLSIGRCRRTTLAGMEQQQQQQQQQQEEQEQQQEQDLLCLQYDMNDCYSRLKRLVPTIPQDKKVSKVEILQHVIDYILDLQLALETHPALHRPPAPAHRTGTYPPPPSRTPLTVLNTDHHQRTSIVKKPDDSILCR